MSRVEWFRSWHGAPTDPKWLGIARKAGVAPGIVAAVAWALMDRASQAEDRGNIEGYDADGLAAFFGCEPEQIEAIVGSMREKGMIEGDRLKSWEKRQPKREDDSAERVRQHRERKKQQPEHNVTHGNAPDTDTDTDTDTELEPTTYEANASSVVERASAPAPAKRMKSPKATRWPSDRLPDTTVALPMGFTEQQARKAAETFRDYWCSKPGKDGVKLDWDATWRNWLRRDAERLGAAPAVTGQPVATGPPQAPPGAPSDEELRRKYGKPDGPSQRHREDLLRNRLGVHPGRGNDGPKPGHGHPAGDGGMVGVGTLLRRDWLGAGGNEDVPQRPDLERHDAGDVA